ncbi:hypothetical protein Hypma_009880 [Hypsizygus marmoreus]|uniref:Uncharacterized protein n=1 Tax=Hypsizygus marmoreus TaxID=39966 RepID=A0A369JW68_HYPMA|nr:hypothetical protein Hypma_009880 [Hypsizygus marmoreus]
MGDNMFLCSRWKGWNVELDGFGYKKRLQNSVILRHRRHRIPLPTCFASQRLRIRISRSYMDAGLRSLNALSASADAPLSISTAMQCLRVAATTNFRSPIPRCSSALPSPVSNRISPRLSATSHTQFAPWHQRGAGAAAGGASRGPSIYDPMPVPLGSATPFPLSYIADWRPPLLDLAAIFVIPFFHASTRTPPPRRRWTLPLSINITIVASSQAFLPTASYSSCRQPTTWMSGDLSATPMPTPYLASSQAQQQQLPPATDHSSRIP